MKLVQSLWAKLFMRVGKGNDSSQDSSNCDVEQNVANQPSLFVLPPFFYVLFHVACCVDQLLPCSFFLMITWEFCPGGPDSGSVVGRNLPVCWWCDSMINTAQLLVFIFISGVCPIKNLKISEPHVRTCLNARGTSTCLITIPQHSASTKKFILLLGKFQRREGAILPTMHLF